MFYRFVWNMLYVMFIAKCSI